MILCVWVLVFAVLHLPLTSSWGQFGFEPQTFSCTLGRHTHIATIHRKKMAYDVKVNSFIILVFSCRGGHSRFFHAFALLASSQVGCLAALNTKKYQVREQRE